MPLVFNPLSGQFDQTNTDASRLTSGTLADARLSSNVSLDNADNNFSVNQTFQGTNNTAPNQTAASGSSLMTRDLVDARFATPRNRYDFTHYFGVSGIGAFVTAGTGPTSQFLSSGIGGPQGAWGINSSFRIGSGAAGAGLRLGSNAVTGGVFLVSNNAGEYFVRLRLGKAFNQGNGAAAFILGANNSSGMWHAGSLGLYYVPQPTLSWAATTAFSQHDRIDVGGVVWAVSTAGTTGSSAPTWTNTIDGTVTDGTVTWRNCGPHTSNTWKFGFGGTDSSTISLTNTGKAGWTTSQRADVILTIRFGGQSAAPYVFYGSVENSAGVSSELSVSTNTNLSFNPQIWSRGDVNSTAAESALALRYFSIQSTLPALL